MLHKFIISGNSMEPDYKEGDHVVTFSYMFSQPKKGDIIVFRKNNLNFIKKIEKDINGQYFVSSINEIGSNSNSLGFVDKQDIMGRVIMKFRD